MSTTCLCVYVYLYARRHPRMPRLRVVTRRFVAVFENVCVCVCSVYVLCRVCVLFFAYMCLV